MAKDSLIVDGIIVHIAEYKEYDYIVTLVSPQKGKIDAIARGAKKLGRRLFGTIQPFVYGEFVLSQSKDRFSITNVDVQERFYTITNDYTAFLAGQMILQLLGDLAQYDESCAELFKCSYYTLSHLCYSKQDSYDLALYYLLQILKNQGVSPICAVCSCCGASTFENASFHQQYGAICQKCSRKFGGVPISALSLKAIYRMTRLETQNLDKLILPPDVRDELCIAIPPYVKTHLERQYRTLDFLQR